MVKRVGSSRRRARTKLTSSKYLRGKIKVHDYIQTFEKGSKVLLKAKPQVMKGLYALRYHGKIGEVVGKKGRCYEVSIRDGGKQKTLTINPVHLKKA